MNTQFNAYENEMQQISTPAQQESKEIAQQEEIQILYQEKCFDIKRTIEVQVLYQPSNLRHNFKDVPILASSDNDIFLYQLMDSLQMQNLHMEMIDQQSYMVLVKDLKSEMYIYCGSHPVQKDIAVQFDRDQKSISIKIRKIQHKVMDKLIEEHDHKEKRKIKPSFKTNNSNSINSVKKQQSDEEEMEDDQLQESIGQQQESSKKIKTEEQQQISEEQQDQSMKPKEKDIKEKDKKLSNRIKERHIKDVLEKVALWRKFYNGFFNEKNEFVQLPLDQSARKINISKKTLDDYLAQLRLGKKYGFDFNKNSEEKIGTLRSFVREQKAKFKELNQEQHQQSQSSMQLQQSQLVSNTDKSDLNKEPIKPQPDYHFNFINNRSDSLFTNLSQGQNLIQLRSVENNNNNNNINNNNNARSQQLINGLMPNFDQQSIDNINYQQFQ